MEITIDLNEVWRHYDETAKLHLMPEYVAEARDKAGYGNIVTLTGGAPIWMYLTIAHALHGMAITLYYDSPATGKVVIFNHDPR